MRQPHRPAIVAAAISAAFFALYCATLTQVHTFDALSYVLTVERKPWTEVFHPHHLAYGPLGTLALAIGRWLGYSGGAALPMQLLNAAAGALGVALLWRLALRCTGDHLAATVAALLMGGSYAYWYYAVEIEVYTVAALFLILCLTSLARQPGWRQRDAALLGVAQSCAVLFHQTNLLLCAPIALSWLLWAASSHNRRAVIWPLLVYSATLAVGVIGPYAYVAISVSHFPDAAAFVAWLTEYARTGWWGGRPSWANVVRLGQGLSQTLLAQGGALAWGALGLAALWGVLAGRGVVRSREPRGSGPGRQLSAVLLLWLLVYGAFFFWWEPDNIEFWIATLPPLALLLAIAIAQTDAANLDRASPRHAALRRGPAALALAATLAMLALNGQAIARRGDASTDLQRVIARAIAERSAPADLLVVPDGLLELYLPYYERREQFTSLNQALFDADNDPQAACAAIAARIELARHAGATALIAEEALRPPPALLARHRIAQRDVDACFVSYRAELRRIALPAALPPYLALPNADDLARSDGWSFSANAQGWQAQAVERQTFAAGWTFIPQVDPALTGPLLNQDAATVDAIEVELANGTGQGDAQLFWADASGTMVEARSLHFSIAPRSGRRTYRIALRGAPGWQGTIGRLRLDPVGAGDGGAITVYSIRLVKR